MQPTLPLQFKVFSTPHADHWVERNLRSESVTNVPQLYSKIQPEGPKPKKAAWEWMAGRGCLHLAIGSRLPNGRLNASVQRPEIALAQ